MPKMSKSIQTDSVVKSIAVCAVYDTNIPVQISYHLFAPFSRQINIHQYTIYFDLFLYVLAM